jgi:hypothetical protein
MLFVTNLIVLKGSANVCRVIGIGLSIFKKTLLTTRNYITYVKEGGRICPLFYVLKYIEYYKV